MGAVQFALLLVLIIVASIAAWQMLGHSVVARVDEISASGDGTTADQPIGSQPEGIPAIKERGKPAAAHGGNK